MYLIVQKRVLLQNRRVLVPLIVQITICEITNTSMKNEETIIRVPVMTSCFYRNWLMGAVSSYNQSQVHSSLANQMFVGWYLHQRFTKDVVIRNSVFSFKNLSIIIIFFLVDFPEGFIWYYPKFPSFTVVYESSNDFLYSGHVGICIIFVLEHY